MPMTREAYETLQVSPSAEPEVIAAAYRRLAQKYHPDVNSSPAANQRMQDLNWAFEILRDPRRRAAYDRTRPFTAPRPPYESPQAPPPGHPPPHHSRSPSGPPQYDPPPPPPSTPSSAATRPTARRPLIYLLALLVGAGLFWSFATRSSQPITAKPSQITITSRPTAVPPPTGIGTSPTASPSRRHIHGLYFDLPPGWCWYDNWDFITSLCPGRDDTEGPLVYVQFALPEIPPESARGAIADYAARTDGRVLESPYPPP